MGKGLKKDRYLASLEAIFLTLPSYRRFPKDDEFKRELKIKDLYNFRSRSYWLRRLENYERKELVLVDEYTIEHIMPQCGNDPEKVPEEWKQALGNEWKTVWETYRHTLGNLTLTRYNPELSNRNFTEKRDMEEEGFANSPLWLNKALGKQAEWNRETIEQRADFLAEKATQVWRIPDIEAQPEAVHELVSVTTTTGYTIENHPHLTSAPLRNLFESFRKQILALDPVVSEEFLESCVAYKAETNFVSVLPEATRLMNLSL